MLIAMTTASIKAPFTRCSRVFQVARGIIRLSLRTGVAWDDPDDDGRRCSVRVRAVVASVACFRAAAGQQHLRIIKMTRQYEGGRRLVGRLCGLSSPPLLLPPAAPKVSSLFPAHDTMTLSLAFSLAVSCRTSVYLGGILSNCHIPCVLSRSLVYVLRLRFLRSPNQVQTWAYGTCTDEGADRHSISFLKKILM